MTERGGLLYRCGAAPGGLAFLSSDVARTVTTLAAITPIENARAPLAGVALSEGKVVTVLDVGAGPTSRGGDSAGRAARAVVCEVDGHTVALIGGTIVATGLFTALDDDAVEWRGERADALDLRAIYGSAEAAAWADRALMEDR